MGKNIVILDGQLANPGDLSWKLIEDQGTLKVYNSTESAHVTERCKNADIVITNKVKLDEQHFRHLPKLELICLLATGYDNINLEDAKTANITVCNAVGYGVDSVAQHVFALILNCYNRVSQHNTSIQLGEWTTKQWSYTLSQLRELNGKTIGIYGFGKIGKRVAEIARVFGLKVIAHHKYPERDKTEGVEFLSLKELFEKADIISLHAPLNDANKEIVNSTLLSRLRPEALLVNTGRGGLIAEEDLKSHLLAHPKCFAALDVLSSEPPPPDHPLIGLDNCILTPHNAWATLESRRRLIQIVGDNIRAFLEGAPKNTVVL